MRDGEGLAVLGKDNTVPFSLAKPPSLQCRRNLRAPNRLPDLYQSTNNAILFVVIAE